MDKAKLKAILQKLAGQKILVLGDLMVDEYIWGKASRISPEAPVPVVEVGHQSFVLGGASNVAHNICSLGGQVALVGIVGSDQTGKNLKTALEEKGLTTRGILLDETRPTTLKTRVIAHNQQVVRIDREDKSPLSSAMEEKIIGYVEQQINHVDALIISDYGKGVITPRVAQGVIALAKEKNKVIAVDPKGTDYSKYKGVTLLTPNKKETETALNTVLDTPEKLIAGGRKLKESLDLAALLVTRGDEGMSLFNGDNQHFHIPAVASKVYDVTGAGDTVISTLILALAAGAALPEAMVLFNYAAAVVVKKVGTSTVTRKEILEIIKDGEEDAGED